MTASRGYFRQSVDPQLSQTVCERCGVVVGDVQIHNRVCSLECPDQHCPHTEHEGRCEALTGTGRFAWQCSCPGSYT